MILIRLLGRLTTSWVFRSVTAINEFGQIPVCISCLFPSNGRRTISLPRRGAAGPFYLLFSLPSSSTRWPYFLFPILVLTLIPASHSASMPQLLPAPAAAPRTGARPSAEEATSPPETVIPDAAAAAPRDVTGIAAVSYTHLTLPTKA